MHTFVCKVTLLFNQYKVKSTNIYEQLDIVSKMKRNKHTLTRIVKYFQIDWSRMYVNTNK